MRSPSTVDVLFALLIAGSLVGKVVVHKTEPPPGGGELTSRLQSVLQQSGLAAHVIVFPRVGGIVYGSRARCRLWATDYTPYGTRLAEYRAWAHGYGPLTFVYRGATYGRPPKLDPLVRYLIARELSRIGLRADRSPVIAIAASKECNLEGVDWTSLKEVAW